LSSYVSNNIVLLIGREIVEAVANIDRPYAVDLQARHYALPVQESAASIPTSAEVHLW
jgi:hypothetical protein